MVEKNEEEERRQALNFNKRKMSSPWCEGGLDWKEEGSQERRYWGL